SREALFEQIRPCLRAYAREIISAWFLHPGLIRQIEGFDSSEENGQFRSRKPWRDSDLVPAIGPCSLTDPIETVDDVQQFLPHPALGLSSCQALIECGENLRLLFRLEQAFKGLFTEDLVVGLLTDRPACRQAEFQAETAGEGKVE